MKNLFYYLSVFLLFLGCATQPIEKKSIIEWDFPLPRPHTGILLGNGTQGLMVWGEENKLIITIGRAGFWDHRGGNVFTTNTTYKEVAKMLYAGDETGLRKAFNIPEKRDRNALRPHQVGGGRLVIELPEGMKLKKGYLAFKEGVISVEAQTKEGKPTTINIEQAFDKELAWVTLPDEISENVKLELIPSWVFVKEQMTAWNVEKPEQWSNTESGELGFVQTLPEDLPLTIAAKKKGSRISIATDLSEEGKTNTQNLFEEDYKETMNNTKTWWQKYWEDLPVVNLPDKELQEIVDYGLYKQACCTPPQGLPCSLQGPFMEDYRIPPWSNDYHFNINIEMIYWPALASNRTEHFEPLWDLVMDWVPTLSKNAKEFFQAEGALMLPHAVDDRCQIPGVFWTGMIDHASTAWVAQMAWMNYRYSMDENILKEIAYPLLKGAFEGYYAMLEKISDKENGWQYSLPVSVSPEFKGSSMDAWGRDASFQLAALHMLLDILPQASKVLGEKADARWEDVKSHLPFYTLIEGTNKIALWEGMDLVFSHRHHSHLASIYPFCTIDPFSDEHENVVKRTFMHWVNTGAGAWTGWCVPWASILNSRIDQTEAAVEWLHYWKRNFTNEGRGTLHNAAFPGTSIYYHPLWDKSPEIKNSEVMQLDAGFGALNAVFELLVQNRQGVIHVLPSLHRDWKDVSFYGILTEGAFLIGAKVKDKKVQEVTIESKKGGEIKLVHGMEKYTVNNEVMDSSVFTHNFETGKKVVLVRKE